MFNYQKIKPTLQKYQYETALEYKKTRVTFSELKSSITAMSNALSRMEGKRVCILLRNSFELIVSAFAVSACQKHAMLCDNRVSRAECQRLVDIFGCDILITDLACATRVFDLFRNAGCDKIILTDGAADLDFPGVFDFETLLEQNDYAIRSNTSDYGRIECWYNIGDRLDYDIDSIDTRDGVLCALPMFETLGAKTVSDLLIKAKRVCLEDSIAVKKGKIKFAIDSTDRYKTKKTQIIKPSATQGHYIRLDGAVFDGNKLSKDLSIGTGCEVICEYTGQKIQITLKVEKSADANALYEQSKPIIVDAMRPFDAPAGVRVIKNT